MTPKRAKQYLTCRCDHTWISREGIAPVVLTYPPHREAAEVQFGNLSPYVAAIAISPVLLTAYRVGVRAQDARTQQSDQAKMQTSLRSTLEYFSHSRVCSAPQSA